MSKLKMQDLRQGGERRADFRNTQNGEIIRSFDSIMAENIGIPTLPFTILSIYTYIKKIKS